MWSYTETFVSPNAVIVDSHGTYNDNKVWWLEVKCAKFEDASAFPNAVVFKGRTYGRKVWIEKTKMLRYDTEVEVAWAFPIGTVD